MKTIDYKALHDFVNVNKEQWHALLHRFNAADATLSADELAQLYFASPFADGSPLHDLVLTANKLYKIRDYRVAYFMYRDALACDPLSLMLHKKAANCSFFAVIDRDATQLLLQRVKMLQEVIASTGDGTTADTPLRVVKTSDAYQYLWDVMGVKDVISCNVVRADGNESVDELLVQLRSEKEPRKVYVACYGETEADRADFFIRKKGF
ncbi:MAG: DUF4919 domain-containing protein [Sodaliphilus sp.]